MGKVKKNKSKKRNLSEAPKPDKKKKTLNPFEIHVNRQKYNVIGRKLKADKGLPGVSRSRAMKKRKATLLQEYKIKDKSNKFLDRRIGEKNRAMTAEDRVTARFTAERMKRHNKKSMFNLDDNEVLTHRGQTLNEIEKFDDPRSDDEDDEERGKLEAEFVGDAHFGGGVLRRSDNNDKMSRKDLIEQLIAESKKRKAEKQRVREQTLELTEKLDTEWKDLLPIVSASKKKPEDHEDVTKPDSYDTVMRELKFEARGKASDPLKSAEALAKEESGRLDKLEAERQKRMHGFTDELLLSSNHRSADDLDDGFEIESDSEVVVSYNAEGRLQAQGTKQEKEEMETDDNVKTVEEGSEKESSEEDCDDSDSVKEEEEEEEEEDKGVKGDISETEEEEDNLSDLKHISESETEAEVTHTVTKCEHKKPTSEQVVEATTEPFLDEKKKRSFIETATEKFPHLSQVPGRYEDLQTILSSYSVEYQGVIIEHIMKSNHSGLSEGNKHKLETLFAYLLQYLHDAPVPTREVQDRCHCFAVLDRLTPQLYELAHLNPDNAWHCIIEVVKEKQLHFRKNSHTYPSLDSLVFFKVISLLFPTSDFRHPVVTPALVFMCQMLLQCRVRTKRDVATGLFLVALILEYTVLSKRFSPAAINFLRGVVHAAVPKTANNSLPTIPPFRNHGAATRLLVLTDSVESLESSHSMVLADLSDEVPIDNSFRIRALSTAVAMLSEFQVNLESLPASYEIFKPISTLLSKLVDDRYPERLKDEVLCLTAAIDKMRDVKIQLLVVEKKRAKALRLYEPNIEKVFDCKRRRPMGREKQEHEKLLHKYKREEKAALREIRRDNTFIAKLKWKETLRSDMERNKKVKEIFGSAAAQQGELRQLKRKK